MVDLDLDLDLDFVCYFVDFIEFDFDVDLDLDFICYCNCHPPPLKPAPHIIDFCPNNVGSGGQSLETAKGDGNGGWGPNRYHHRKCTVLISTIS